MATDTEFDDSEPERGQNVVVWAVLTAFRATFYKDDAEVRYSDVTAALAVGITIHLVNTVVLVVAAASDKNIPITEVVGDSTQFSPATVAGAMAMLGITVALAVVFGTAAKFYRGEIA